MSENVNVISRTAMERPRFTEGEMEDQENDLTIGIQTIEDIVTARQRGRMLAQELNFSSTQSTLVATVISELARNIILYAGKGEIALCHAGEGHRKGVRIIATDHGPGIEDISRALISGYSSSGGLGLGLPGVKQLVDEFTIKSELGEGTEVNAVMWAQ